MNSRVLSQDPTSPASPDCPSNTETQILFGIDQDDSPKIWTGIERVASSSPRTDRSQKAMVQYFLVQPQTATAQLPPELLDDSSRTIVVEIADPRTPLNSPAAGASDLQRWQDPLNTFAPDPTVSRLDRLFSVAHDEQFEAGVESRFSMGLQQLFQTDPLKVLDSLSLRLMESHASPEVLSEMLEWASRREAGPLRGTIVQLLSIGLCNRSSLVRDAAALGLAYLEGSAAAGPLRQAIEREEVPELREDLTDLVRSLESEDSWQSSSGS